MAVVLDLVVDASGVQTGSKTAEAALSGVQQASTKTQASLAAIGPSTSKSIQAVAGVSQIGRNLTDVTRAFADMNVQSLAFVGANLALSVTRTASAFEVLKIALRTNPLFVVATALGVISTALALFSKNTREATSDFEKLAKTMEQTALDVRVSAGLGVPTSFSQQRTAEMKQLYDVYAAVEKDRPVGPGGVPRTYTLLDIQRLLGGDINELARDLGVRLPTMQETGGSLLGRLPGGGGEIPYSQFQSYLRQRYEDVRLSREPTAGDAERASAMSKSWAAAEEASRAAALRKQKEADDAHIAALEKMISLSAQVGAALGAGVWDVLSGLQGWRQVLMGIVNSFGRQGLSSLGANLFGTTARQATGRTSPGGGGGGGGGGVEVGFGGIA